MAQDGVGPSIGVVICAYSMQRWADLLQGARAVSTMLEDGDRVLVVIDHNDVLARRARTALPEEVDVVVNDGRRGLSDARNTAVRRMSTDIVAFLDDDAYPDPGWLAGLRRQFADPRVVGVGGAIRPLWEGGVAPGWFPPEFGWVLGCDYRGLPGNGAQIRNPIGASMALRRDRITAAGGFPSSVGRVGTRPVGTEETELCIRMRQADPGCRIVRDTSAVVHHRVPRSRQTVRYFVSRCYHEGVSKAGLSRSVGAGQGLRSERSYVLRTLATGMARHLRDALRGDPSGIARATMLPVGLSVTTAGFTVGHLHQARSQRREGTAVTMPYGSS